MKMEIQRILIVGLGSIGKRHLRLARKQFPKGDIRILRHQGKDEIPEYASGCFTDLDNAIAFKPQLAVIANPSPMHLDIAIPLADQGVHLLIEKPLATSSDGIQILLKTCSNNNSVLMVGYNLRFLSSLQKFRELLHNNIIGKILFVRCEVGQNLLSWRPEMDYRQTVSAQSSLGGGVLLELSHEIDYLQWIFGEISWVLSSCSRQSDLELDVEDTVCAILGFNPGNLKGSINMDFIRHDTTRNCIAIGENGTLHWDAISGKINFFQKDTADWQILYKAKQKRDDSFLAEWEHFLHCIQVGQTPLVSGHDGLSVLQTIEAIKESSNFGVMVYTSKDPVK